MSTDTLLALCAGLLIGSLITLRIMYVQVQYWRSVARTLTSIAAIPVHLVATLQEAKSIYEAFGSDEAWRFTVAEVEAKFRDPMEPGNPMEGG